MIEVFEAVLITVSLVVGVFEVSGWTAAWSEGRTEALREETRRAEWGVERRKREQLIWTSEQSVAGHDAVRRAVPGVGEAQVAQVLACVREMLVVIARDSDRRGRRILGVGCPSRVVDQVLVVLKAEPEQPASDTEPVRPMALPDSWFGRTLVLIEADPDRFTTTTDGTLMLFALDRELGLEGAPNHDQARLAELRAVAGREVENLAGHLRDGVRAGVQHGVRDC
jgi:hypothetical protein